MARFSVKFQWPVWLMSKHRGRYLGKKDPCSAEEAAVVRAGEVLGTKAQQRPVPNEDKRRRIVSVLVICFPDDQLTILTELTDLSGADIRGLREQGREWPPQTQFDRLYIICVQMEALLETKGPDFRVVAWLRDATLKRALNCISSNRALETELGKLVQNEAEAQ